MNRTFNFIHQNNYLQFHSEKNCNNKNIILLQIYIYIYQMLIFIYKILLK